MARARNIKPAFFLNTDLSEIEPLGRLAFIGLWTIADYKGCIEANLKRIKAQILPYDNCDIESIMIKLEQFRFIRYYFVQGVKYIKILNFEKHQNPHKNEKQAGSNIPDITEKDNEIIELSEDGTKPDFIGTARADSLLLIPDSLNPLPVKTESRKNALVSENDFETFWKRYPKKVGKDAALKSWVKLKPRIDDVMFSLAWQIKSDAWAEKDGKFIPNPATYLNQGRWKDEPKVNEGNPF